MEIMVKNGHFVAEEEATVSVMDHGLMYGAGVFETIRVYKGHPFLIEDHITRLNDGLNKMKIRQPYSLSEWEHQIFRLLEKRRLLDASIRIMVTAGDGGWGLTKDYYPTPNTMIFARPLLLDSQQLFNRGRKLQLTSVTRQSPGGWEPYKSNNYLNNLLARQEVIQFPDVEGIMLSSQGFLAEGIISNLFFVLEGILCTPCCTLGILPGITRGMVIQMARSLEIPVEEGYYRLECLQKAEEIFITNSFIEIVPIYEWQGERKVSVKTVSKLINKYGSYTPFLRSVNDLIEDGLDN